MEQYLLFTNGAYDTNCYPVRTVDELAQLTGSEYYRRQLADYRAGNSEAKRRMLALIPQARLRHPDIWLHQAEHLVPSGWVFLDDDRPATEITAEERHRLVEERLSQLGMSDIPHVALRSSSYKYHLLVPFLEGTKDIIENHLMWEKLLDGVLVLDPSTTNVNRLMFFTGELLTPPESVEWLFEASPSLGEEGKGKREKLPPEWSTLHS